MAKMVRRVTTRAGKRSRMQEAHDSFVFARYLFMAVIVASIIILTGVIITLGPLDITVADAYRALIARFFGRKETNDAPA